MSDTPTQHNSGTTNDNPDLDSAKTFAHIVYGLHLLGFYTLLLPIAGVVLNYIKIDDARGTWLESHYRWQTRTFWFGLLWCLIAAPFLLIPFINFIPYIFLVAWWLYRNLKGWIRLAEGKEMYVEYTPSNTTIHTEQSDSEH